MNQNTAVVEHCIQPRLYVGHIPGFPGMHGNGAAFNARHANLDEVVETLDQTEYAQ